MADSSPQQKDIEKLTSTASTTSRFTGKRFLLYLTTNMYT